MKQILLAVFVAVGLLACVVGVTQAGPYVPQAPLVAAVPGPVIPGPTLVPGKEYSTHRDLHGNPLHTPDPGQVIAWDGAGGTADSNIDYVADNDPQPDGPQVDALANLGDALFDAVIKNQAALLFCVQGDNLFRYESIGGAGGIWANPLQVNQAPEYVDALEVWGVDGPANDDANRASFHGDPGRVAVVDTAGNTIITDAQIAAAIGRPELESEIDLDALMMYGASILFSIEPIANFDGGEVWVWDGTNPAQFLNHGGHLWDTAFNVQAAFNTNSENVWALEAVAQIPEPLSVLVWGGLALAFGVPAWLRWRRA